MKKYGLIFCLCLLSATNVKADFQPSDYQPCYTVGLGASATYWSTVDNVCRGCGEGCTSCVEELTTYSGTTTPLSMPFCTSCRDGYELRSSNSGKSQRCEISCPSHCFSCSSSSSSSSSCTLCNNGYTLSNGQCVEKVACPSNCAECDSSGVCVKCNNGYVLKNGACAVKPKTQIAFCPPDKTLTADLCCCVSK